MKRFRFFGVPLILMGLAAVAVGGLAITFLWNALMPQIFGLTTITFWQSLGLFLLGRLLFGRFGGPGRRFRGARIARGWNRLTPEERDRFRSAMGSHCPAEFGRSETEKA